MLYQKGINQSKKLRQCNLETYIANKEYSSKEEFMFIIEKGQ